MHPAYVESLAEFGTPRELPRCGGWILERGIRGLSYRDAMGCYPLFACRDWSQLHMDLDELGNELVCLSLVADPFGDYDLPYLRRCFSDVVVPFKEHFIIDLHQSPKETVSPHHHRYVRKALEKLSVEKHEKPTQFLNEWLELHKTLVDRHHIRGIRAFSRKAFAKQLNMPGMVVLRAMHQDKTVAAILWIVQKDIVYGHVLGFSDVGYKLGAQYALYWFAIEYFADKVRWCDIGGVPGLKDEGRQGLSWFKQGWSTETRTAYFCGRILNRKRYTEIVKAKGISAADYFPAYRQGEME